MDNDPLYFHNPNQIITEQQPDSQYNNFPSFDKIFEINLDKFQEIATLYQCYLCNKNYTNTELFQLHIQQHFGDSIGCNICLICDYTCRTAQGISTHIATKHKLIQAFICCYCNLKFYSKYNLKIHLNTHKNDILKCLLTNNIDYANVKTCDKIEYKNLKELVQHIIEIHHKPKNDYLIKSINKNTQFENVKGKLKRCSLCDKSFDEIHLLNEHIMEHIDDGPFECPDCAELFEDLKMYQNHILEHDAAKYNEITEEPNLVSLNIISVDAVDDHDDSFVEDQDDNINNDDDDTDQLNATALIDISQHALDNELKLIDENHQIQLNDNDNILEFDMLLPNKIESAKNKDNNVANTLKKLIKKKPIVSIDGIIMKKTDKPKYTRKPVSLAWQEKDNKVRSYHCETCNRNFTLASSLALHYRRTHLGIKPYECTVCNWKFAQSSDLTKHMRKHTGERPYKCTYCKMAFSQNRNLRNHMKMHTEQPSICKYCNKKFAIDTSLVQHLKKHESPDAEKCTICAIPFSFAHDLKAHLKRYHSNGKPHKCQFCEKTFAKSCDMKKHKRIHTGERPFSCNICAKTFSYMTSLRNHQAVHTGDRPHQCTVCGQSFSFSGNLKVHMRSHTGERPYKCTYCPKAFMRSANLNEHIKIHTGEKSHPCPVCQKTFTNSSAYSKHKKIHTGERPHKCMFCSKSFVQLAHLVNHRRVHTGEKPFSCKICKKFYRRSDTLSSHMKTHNKKKKSKSKQKLSEDKQQEEENNITTYLNNFETEIKSEESNLNSIQYEIVPLIANSAGETNHHQQTSQSNDIIEFSSATTTATTINHFENENLIRTCTTDIVVDSNDHDNDNQIKLIFISNL